MQWLAPSCKLHALTIRTHRDRSVCMWNKYLAIDFSHKTIIFIQTKVLVKLNLIILPLEVVGVDFAYHRGVRLNDIWPEVQILHIPVTT